MICRSRRLRSDAAGPRSGAASRSAAAGRRRFRGSLDMKAPLKYAAGTRTPPVVMAHLRLAPTRHLERAPLPWTELVEVGGISGRKDALTRPEIPHGKVASG